MVASTAQILDKVSRVQKQLFDLSSWRSGDKQGLKITAAMAFFAGDNTVGELVFNVPKYARFEANRLNLYAGYRNVNLTDDTATDVTFRPVDYAYVPNFYFTGFNIEDNINLNFAVRDSVNGDAQNAPCDALACFSGRIYTPLDNIVSPTATSQMPVAGWLGSLEFERYRLPPGSSVTVRVSPTYSFNIVSATTRREYRVFGVLDGRRVVWRR